jgi:hypothetical protein
MQSSLEFCMDAVKELTSIETGLGALQQTSKKYVVPPVVAELEAPASASASASASAAAAGEDSDHKAAFASAVELDEGLTREELLASLRKARERKRAQNPVKGSRNKGRR